MSSPASSKYPLRKKCERNPTNRTKITSGFEYSVVTKRLLPIMFTRSNSVKNPLEAYLANGFKKRKSCFLVRTGMVPLADYIVF